MTNPRAAACLALTIATTGCLGASGDDPGSGETPPEVFGPTVEIADPTGTYPPLALQGHFQREGDRQCVSGEDVALLTAGGPLALRNATLCVTTSPFGLEGEAGVPFPGLGVLAGLGLEVEAPRAYVRLALGETLDAIPIGDLSLTPDPSHYYLIVDYIEGYQADLGAVTLNTPGGEAHLVVDPIEPLIYVAGRTSGLLAHDIEGAFGFSAAGRLPYRSLHPVFDGTRLAPVELDGHLLIQGTLPLGELPIAVAGTFFADVDADDDGRTVFAGDDRDVVLAGDAAVSIGYSVAGFGLSVEIGSASFVYDAREAAAGAFLFGGSADNRIFDGTILEPFQPVSASVEAYGVFRSPEDFQIHLGADYSVLGFPLAAGMVDLGDDGASIDGRLALGPIGEVEVAGEIDASGRFSLTGTGDLTVAGLQLAAARVELTPGGLTVAGRLRLPGVGEAEVSGAIFADGTFDLSGRGDLSPGGLRMANARVRVTPSGASISGGVQFAGTGFQVSGSVSAGGRFNLSGRVSVNLVVVKGTATLKISDRGVGASFTGSACLSSICIDLVGIEIDSQGRICPTFPVIGRKCIDLF